MRQKAFRVLVILVLTAAVIAANGCQQSVPPTSPAGISTTPVVPSVNVTEATVAPEVQTEAPASDNATPTLESGDPDLIIESASFIILQPDPAAEIKSNSIRLNLNVRNTGNASIRTSFPALYRGLENDSEWHEIEANLEAAVIAPGSLFSIPMGQASPPLESQSNIWSLEFFVNHKKAVFGKVTPLDVFESNYDNNGLTVNLLIDDLAAKAPMQVPSNWGPVYVGPQLLAPSGGAAKTPLTPSFSWLPIAVAESYMLIISEDPGLDDIVLNLATARTMVTLPEPLEPGKQYFWALRMTEPRFDFMAISVFTTEAPND